jgi:hypothetical protein
VGGRQFLAGGFGGLQVLAKNRNPTRRATPRGMITAMKIAELERRVEAFVRTPLASDWRSGPPYPVPAEVDLERTMRVTRQREVVQRRVLGDDELRRCEVLWAFAPESDFVRGRALMGDVMASMTCVANPPERRLFCKTPSYAREFLDAAMPGRMTLIAPADLDEYERALAAQRPRLVLLSGLNTNVPTLLRMSVLARRYGAEECWLGNYAAAAPYRILDEAFERVYWGAGEGYLAAVLGAEGGVAHPPAHRMLGDVDWLTPLRRRVRFQTLHLAVRLGCSQRCAYCAERPFSGGVRAAFSGFEPLLDEALALGVRRVYVIDPDFGRLWSPEVEGRLLRALSERRMSWSCLTSAVTLERHGEEMMAHGLRSAYVGIETLAGDGGAAIRSLMNRRWQRNTETILTRLRERGLLIFGLYILANPGETPEMIWSGIERLKRLVPLAQISTNQPFPGTDEFERAAREGWIFDYHPDSMRYGKMVWAPLGQVIDPEVVESLYVAAHRAVNSLDRPGGFFSRGTLASMSGGFARREHADRGIGIACEKNNGCSTS